ncbi:organic cation transporter protein-like [Oratosquilla oratoria]|uniref:organic cation transporter protein-like n=1 Tax=Oratosquilla oratoria TaxID=337810 RepID=UPI003F76CA27
MLIASLIVGYATDLFGKRRFIIVCHIFHLLSGVLAAMSPSVGMYLFSKCLQSVFRMCTGISKFALVMELSSNSLRSYIGSAVGIPWALGQMLLPGIAYYIREWKYLQLILSSPFLYTISYYWFLPESPRWLILRGRYEEAVKVLKTIAYWNKRTLPSDEKLLEMVKSIAIKESGGEQGSEGLVSRGLNQLKELFQTKVKIVRTFVLFFCWFTTAFTYYGISLISVHIGSSEYWYMFFGGLVEIPSAILLWLFIHYVGRRLTLIGCFVMFGASVLCSLVVGDSLIWKMMLSLSGKFAISSAFTLIYLFVIEINTTKSRTLALGLSSVVGRFGSISSPYVNDLIGKTNPRAPAIAFGVFSCIAAISVCILPETRKAILPESRTDVEKIGSGAKGKGSNPTEETNGL